MSSVAQPELVKAIGLSPRRSSIFHKMPRAVPTATDIDNAATKTKKNPTDAQKKAGNYPMGHFRWRGFEISIETPKGATRRGRDRHGVAWEITMPCHYGYIKGAVGKDKDALDVFIGSHPQSEIVFVVDQQLDGQFDEHKCIIGCFDVAEAKALYESAYAPGWRGFMAITPMTVSAFRSWVAQASLRQPAHRYTYFHPQPRVVQKSLSERLEAVLASRPSYPPLVKAVSLASPRGDAPGFELSPAPAFYSWEAILAEALAEAEQAEAEADALEKASKFTKHHAHPRDIRQLQKLLAESPKFREWLGDPDLADPMTMTRRQLPIYYRQGHIDAKHQQALEALQELQGHSGGSEKLRELTDFLTEIHGPEGGHVFSRQQAREKLIEAGKVLDPQYKEAQKRARVAIAQGTLNDPAPIDGMREVLEPLGYQRVVDLPSVGVQKHGQLAHANLIDTPHHFLPSGALGGGLRAQIGNEAYERLLPHIQRANEVVGQEPQATMDRVRAAKEKRAALEDSLNEKSIRNRDFAHAFIHHPDLPYHDGPLSQQAKPSVLREALEEMHAAHYGRMQDTREKAYKHLHPEGLDMYTGFTGTMPGVLAAAKNLPQLPDPKPLEVIRPDQEALNEHGAAWDKLIKEHEAAGTGPGRDEVEGRMNTLHRQMVAESKDRAAGTHIMQGPHGKYVLRPVKNDDGSERWEVAAHRHGRSFGPMRRAKMIVGHDGYEQFPYRTMKTQSNGLNFTSLDQAAEAARGLHEADSGLALAHRTNHVAHFMAGHPLPDHLSEIAGTTTAFNPQDVPHHEHPTMAPELWMEGGKHRHRLTGSKALEDDPELLGVADEALGTALDKIPEALRTRHHFHARASEAAEHLKASKIENGSAAAAKRAATIWGGRKALAEANRDDLVKALADAEQEHHRAHEGYRANLARWQKNYGVENPDELGARHKEQMEATLRRDFEDKSGQFGQRIDEHFSDSTNSHDTKNLLARMRNHGPEPYSQADRAHKILRRISDTGEHHRDEGDFYASGLSSTHPTPNSEEYTNLIRKMLRDAAGDHATESAPDRPWDRDKIQDEHDHLIAVAMNGGEPWDVHGGDKDKAREALLASPLIGQLQKNLESQQNSVSAPDPDMARDLVAHGFASKDINDHGQAAMQAARRLHRFREKGHFNTDPTPDRGMEKQWTDLQHRHNQAASEYGSLDPAVNRAQARWRKKHGADDWETLRDNTHHQFGFDLEADAQKRMADYQPHIKKLLGDEPLSSGLGGKLGGTLGEHRASDEDGNRTGDDLQFRLWKRVSREDKDPDGKLTDFWNIHHSVIDNAAMRHGRDNDLQNLSEEHQDSKHREVHHDLMGYTGMLKNLVQHAWDHHDSFNEGYYPSIDRAVPESSHGTFGTPEENLARIESGKREQLGHVLPVVREYLNHLGSGATDEDVKKLFDDHTHLYMADRARAQARIAVGTHEDWKYGTPIRPMSTSGHGYDIDWGTRQQHDQEKLEMARTDWDKTYQAKEHGAERAAAKAHKAQDDLLFHDLANGHMKWHAKQPRIIYHGTPKGKVDELYDRDTYPSHMAENQRLGPGIYHTMDYRVAKGYQTPGASAHNSDGDTTKPHLYANVVKARNLWNADEKIGPHNLDHLAKLTAHATHLQAHGTAPGADHVAKTAPAYKTLISSNVSSHSGPPTGKDWYDWAHLNQGVSKANLNQTLADHGHDGITHLDRYRPNISHWGETNEGHRVVIPFDGANVKSLHGNSGEFHPATKNIFKALNFLVEVSHEVL